jgi:15-cis-phytoene synthase
MSRPAEHASPERIGTPPGSMRYFAVLFAEQATRPLLHAFYAFESELRDTALGASHDIAHARLQWWSEELTLLADGKPRHPVTIALAPAIAQRPADLERLRQVAHAAALELARTTYQDWGELDAYCVRGSGALQEVIAAALTAPGELGKPERTFAQRLGALVRQTEMLRDFAHEVRRGLLHVPIGALAEAGLDPRRVLEHPDDAALGPLLAAWRTRLEAELAALPSELDASQRRRQAHGLVLAALHVRLLGRIHNSGDASARRADLPPLARLWTAWRTAVASQRP